MTNGEKLKQTFPDAIYPFNNAWLSAKYKEPKYRTTEVYTSVPQLKQAIYNIIAKDNTETINIDKLMSVIDNLQTITLSSSEKSQ